MSGVGLASPHLVAFLLGQGVNWWFFPLKRNWHTFVHCELVPVYFVPDEGLPLEQGLLLLVLFQDDGLKIEFLLDFPFDPVDLFVHVVF